MGRRRVGHQHSYAQTRRPCRRCHLLPIRPEDWSKQRRSFEVRKQHPVREDREDQEWTKIPALDHDIVLELSDFRRRLNSTWPFYIPMESMGLSFDFLSDAQRRLLGRWEEAASGMSLFKFPDFPDFGSSGTRTSSARGLKPSGLWPGQPAHNSHSGREDENNRARVWPEEAAESKRLTLKYRYTFIDIIEEEDFCKAAGQHLLLPRDQRPPQQQLSMRSIQDFCKAAGQHLLLPRDQRPPQHQLSMRSIQAFHSRSRRRGHEEMSGRSGGIETKPATSSPRGPARPAGLGPGEPESDSHGGRQDRFTDLTSRCGGPEMHANSISTEQDESKTKAADRLKRTTKETLHQVTSCSASQAARTQKPADAAAEKVCSSFQILVAHRQVLATPSASKPKDSEAVNVGKPSDSFKEKVWSSSAIEKVRELYESNKLRNWVEAYDMLDEDEEKRAAFLPKRVTEQKPSQLKTSPLRQESSACVATSPPLPEGSFEDRFTDLTSRCGGPEIHANSISTAQDESKTKAADRLKRTTKETLHQVTSCSASQAASTQKPADAAAEKVCSSFQILVAHRQVLATPSASKPKDSEAVHGGKPSDSFKEKVWSSSAIEKVRELYESNKSRNWVEAYDMLDEDEEKRAAFLPKRFTEQKPSQLKSSPLRQESSACVATSPPLPEGSFEDETFVESKKKPRRKSGGFKKAAALSNSTRFNFSWQHRLVVEDPDELRDDEDDFMPHGDKERRRTKLNHYHRAKQAMQCTKNRPEKLQQKPLHRPSRRKAKRDATEDILRRCDFKNIGGAETECHLFVFEKMIIVPEDICREHSCKAVFREPEESASEEADDLDSLVNHEDWYKLEADHPVVSEQPPTAAHQDFDVRCKGDLAELAADSTVVSALMPAASGEEEPVVDPLAAQLLGRFLSQDPNESPDGHNRMKHLGGGGSVICDAADKHVHPSTFTSHPRELDFEPVRPPQLTICPFMCARRMWIEVMLPRGLQQRLQKHLGRSEGPCLSDNLGQVPEVNQASAPVNTEDGQAHVSEHAQLDRLLDIVQKLGEDFSDSQLAVRLIVIRRLVRCGRYTLTVYLDPARRKAVLQLQPSVQQFQNYQLHLQLGRHAAKCSQIHLLRVLLEDRGFKKSIHDLNSYQSELFELGIYPENVAEQDQGQQQSQPAFILDDLRNEEPISFRIRKWIHKHSRWQDWKDKNLTKIQESSQETQVQWECTETPSFRLLPKDERLLLPDSEEKHIAEQKFYIHAVGASNWREFVSYFKQKVQTTHRLKREQEFSFLRVPQP